MIIRPVSASDFQRWLTLWQGYNAFYGRAGETALPDDITKASWARFLDADEPMWALVAEAEGELIGLGHYLFHRSTTSIAPVCYLQDLFTAPAARGRGAGRALIEGVYAAAALAGASRVYWHTHSENGTARALYDRAASHQGFIVYRHELG